MGAQTKAGQTERDRPVEAVETVNEVRLTGRVSGDPELRTMPSGDQMWTLRVVVARAPSARRTSQSVDTLDCVVWGGRLKRSVAGWHDGDVVRVSGAVRRRFFRAGAAVASRVEIDLEAGRVIRRAVSG